MPTSEVLAGETMMDIEAARRKSLSYSCSDPGCHICTQRARDLELLIELVREDERARVLDGIE